MYSKISNNIKGLDIHKLTIAKKFSLIAHSHNLSIDTCAEDIDLSLYNIEHAHCIDERLISKLFGCSIDVEKDKSQRLECGCVVSIVLGLYNTCQNGCSYCYANHNIQTLENNFQLYNKESPLLCSQITELDKVSERKVKNQRNMQLNLFSI